MWLFRMAGIRMVLVPTGGIGGPTEVLIAGLQVLSLRVKCKLMGTSNGIKGVISVAVQIGDRIRLGRKLAGLSLRNLADKAAVSAQAISKYERGLDIPSSPVLLRLARALGVKPEFFFRPEPLFALIPAYRKRARLKKKELEAVSARIQEWLERYLELEYLASAQVKFDRPAVGSTRAESLDEMEEAAVTVRQEWDLGLDPIQNLMELLEDRGIRVGLVEGFPHFDACAFWADGVPVIAVKKDLPVDRQRFNLAHELAHLLFPEPGNPAGEAIAHRFAGAFLVPAQAVYQELGRRRQSLGYRELYLLKHKYGLSMQGWIARARDLNIISPERARYLFQDFRRQGWHKREPGKQLPPEEPKRMERLALRAVAEALISSSRAAELLGKSMEEFRYQMMEEYGEPTADLYN